MPIAFTEKQPTNPSLKALL